MKTSELEAQYAIIFGLALCPQEPPQVHFFKKSWFSRSVRSKVSKIVKIEKSGTNLNISFKSNLTSQFSIDQSLSHNGICLTIVKIKDKI